MGRSHLRLKQSKELKRNWNLSGKWKFAWRKYCFRNLANHLWNRSSSGKKNEPILLKQNTVHLHVALKRTISYWDAKLKFIENYSIVECWPMEYLPNLAPHRISLYLDNSHSMPLGLSRRYSKFYLKKLSYRNTRPFLVLRWGRNLKLPKKRYRFWWIWWF